MRAVARATAVLCALPAALWDALSATPNSLPASESTVSGGTHENEEMAARQPRFSGAAAVFWRLPNRHRRLEPRALGLHATDHPGRRRGAGEPPRLRPQDAAHRCVAGAAR